MQIQAEVGRGAEAAREQILRHFCRTTHVGLDNDVTDDGILFCLGFVREDALVELVVEAREVAGLLGFDEAHAIHATRQMLRIAQITM